MFFEMRFSSSKCSDSTTNWIHIRWESPRMANHLTINKQIEENKIVLSCMMPLEM